MTPPFARLQSLFQDLRRRRVFRTGVWYGGAILGVLGVLDIARDLIPALDRIFPYLVLIGVFLFPLVLVLAWAFDITPDGIVISGPAEGEDLRIWNRIGTVVVVGIASVAFGLVVFHWWDRSETARDAAVSGRIVDPTRIAVLYFDDHSPGGELGYLANGLTEDLINELVNVDGLTVTSRNGVKPFRDNPPSMDSIGRALDVGTIVEGSVTGSGGLIRVTAQLIDAATGDHLRSEQFEAESVDVLELQDQLVESIAQDLRASLGVTIREREARSGVTDAEAWREYQEALVLFDEGRAYEVAGEADLSLDLYRLAEAGLGRAAGLEPDWADPLVQLGWVSMKKSAAMNPNTGYVRPEDGPTLLRLAQRAVEVSGGAAAALELRGALRFELAESGGDAEGLREPAEADLAEAIRLDPRRARALAYLSASRRVAGDFSGARLYAQRALQADAFLEEAPDIIYRLFEANLELKDWRGAEDWCVAGRRRYPDENQFLLCRIYLVSLSPEPGEPELAWALLDTLQEDWSEEAWLFTYRTWGGLQVARLLARRSLPDSAEAVLAAYGAAEEDRPYFAYDEASVRLALGDRAGALDLLELYLSVRPDRRAYLPEDWLFEELWGDSAFVSLTSPR